MTTRVACALLATVFITQAPSFEGRVRLRTIQLQVDEDGTEASLLDVAAATLAAREDVRVDSALVLIKANVIRTGADTAGDDGYGLWDLTRHIMQWIQPNERAYIEVLLDAIPPERRSAGAAEPRSLGNRVINGMKAAGYEIHQGEVIVRAWMTQDHPGLTWAFREALAHDSYDDEDDPEDVATAQLARFGFPVVLYTLTRGSLQVEETLGIERIALAPEKFKVPAGYARRELDRP